MTKMELLPGVWGIYTSAVMMYLVVGEERAVLIDTAYGFIDPHEIIREITPLPFDVVVSHGHFDHVGGVFWFSEENVYIHEADMSVYKVHGSPEYRKKAVDTLRKLQRLLFFMRWKLVPKKLDVEIYCNRKFHDFCFIKEGDCFALGGCNVKIVEFPGHTPGSIGIWIPEKQLIIVSDAANPVVWLFLPESMKLSVYCESLKKIEKMDFSYILTGHSQKLFTRSDVRAWLEVAQDLDFEHGKKVKNEFNPGVEVRKCYKRGSTRKDKNRPFIKISKDKL